MSYIKEEEDTVGGGWWNVHLSNVCEISKSPSTLFGGAGFGRTESVKQLNDILPESLFEECGNSVQRQNPLIPLEKCKSCGKRERPRFRAKLDLQWRRLNMLRPY
jgi:hypothetical protein